MGWLWNTWGAMGWGGMRLRGVGLEHMWCNGMAWGGMRLRGTVWDGKRVGYYGNTWDYMELHEITWGGLGLHGRVW